MKKTALSSFVIIGFVLYSVSQSQSDPASPVAAGAPPSDPVTTVDPPISPGPTSGIGSLFSPPTSSPTLQPTQSGQYKDGTYTGPAVDAFYGLVQVKATVSGGKLTRVDFLQYPNDRGHSIMINQYAMPFLKSEAIQAQNARVGIVSGATDTSLAFMQSLDSALSQAQ